MSIGPSLISRFIFHYSLFVSLFLPSYRCNSVRDLDSWDEQKRRRGKSQMATHFVEVVEQLLISPLPLITRSAVAYLICPSSGEERYVWHEGIPKSARCAKFYDYSGLGTEKRANMKKWSQFPVDSPPRERRDLHSLTDSSLMMKFKNRLSPRLSHFSLPYSSSK